MPRHEGFRTTPGGKEAVDYWYNPEYFDPNECELPVDSRVLSNWNDVFENMGMKDLLAKDPPHVSQKARKLAKQYRISPSAFDAILFFGMHGT